MKCLSSTSTSPQTFRVLFEILRKVQRRLDCLHGHCRGRHRPHHNPLVLYRPDQTLPDPSLPSQGTARRELEYKRSVHVYCVADAYGLGELEWLAKQQIRLHEGCVDIYQTLAVAREVLPVFKGRMDLSIGYLAYLREKLMFAFKIDRNCCKKDEFFECLGQIPELDKFVLKTVIELHSSEISELEDTMRFAKEIEETENVDDSGETVHEDECPADPPVQNEIVWTEPEMSEGLAPGYEVSSADPETPPSDSEESWSDLESLSIEIDRVDYWKD